MAYYKDESRKAQIYLDSLQTSHEFIKKTININAELLLKHDITLKEQFEHLEKKGLKMAESTIRTLKSGITKTCATVYLSFYAMYWGVSMIDFAAAKSADDIIVGSSSEPVFKTIE